MRKLLTALVVLPIAALLLLFALANRVPVVVSLDPFSPGEPAWSIQLPLFLVIILAVMLGVIVGGFADWLRQGRYRREARYGRSEVRRLEQEAEVLRRARTAENANQQSDALPVPYRGE